MKQEVPLLTRPAYWQCPYCLRPVGLIGNWLAVIFGTSMHGCDFRNCHPEHRP